MTINEPINLVIANRYRVISQLGAGGMGKVYRVLDRLTGKPAALKRVNVPTASIRISRNNEANPDVALAREFRFLASLHHPNIINVFDYGFDEAHQPYYVMTLIEQVRTITQAAHGRDLVQKMNLLIDMLQALVYLHRRDILHRDLKPDNALVNKDDQLQLVDFGLSVEGSHALGMSGTLAYMSPEILRSGEASIYSDLYSVGVIAYELFAGKHPFDTRNLNELFKRVLDQPPDLSAMQAPDPLKWVINRLLAKDPQDRYASAGEVLQALCQAADIPLPEETITIRESFLNAAKFVGRQRELHLLTNALEAGNRSSWLVGGEAGVGKSRLLEEVRIAALVNGLTVVRGQAVEGGGLPYQLLRSVLPMLILGCDLSPLEAGVILPLVPEIARLLEREVERVPELDPKEAGERLKHIILDLFRRQNKPMLLVLEDIHWAEDTLHILEALINVQTNFPLVTIATYRSDDAPHLPKRLNAMRIIPLERLVAAEVETLSASMLEKTGRDPQLINFLLKQTEGNAFFIVDILQTLADYAGRLDAIGLLTLPESLLSKGVLAIAERRLERIPETHHVNIRLAAVIGREIDLELVQFATGGANQDWIDHGLEGAILEASEGRLRFSHDRIREGILHYTDAVLLRELHERAAHAIEMIYAADERYYPVLARHYGAAANVEREAYYALAAGKQAVRLNQFTGAQTYFERVLALLPDDDAVSLDAVNELGKVYHTVGRFDIVKTLYSGFLALPHLPPQTRIDALITFAEATRREGDSDQAIIMAQTAYDLSAGYVESKARALVVLAHAKLKTHPVEEILPLFNEAISLFQHLSNLESWRELLYLSMKIYVLMDKEVVARQPLIDHLIAEVQRGNPNIIALSYANLGALYLLSSEYELAHDYFVKARDIAHDIGNTRLWANTWSNMTYLFILKGDFANTLIHFREVVRISRSYHILTLIVSSIYLAAQIKRQLGELITATAWVVFTSEHPAVELDVRHVARQTLEQFKTELAPEDYESALALGNSLTLQAIYAVIDADLMPTASSLS